MFRRRKVCKFCSDKIDDINYKDVKLLMPFVPERAKVLPRRISGTCALHQRKLRTAIMRARQLALIPYTDGVSRMWRRRSRQKTEKRHHGSHPQNHVDNVGKRGEIVKVANGYARNYLLPRKLALLATEGNKRHVERERKIVEAREAGEKSQAEGIAARLTSIDIAIERRVGDTEQLYGSVTAVDIADYLKAQGFEIDRRKLILPEPIKAIGEHTVPLKLHREVTVPLKVRVVKEGGRHDHA